MGAFNLTTMREILYFFAVKFDKFSPATRTKFAMCYNIIILTAAILNGIVLYVFVTKSALRKPFNLVLSALLWKSIFLLLTAMPVTLLELCIEVVRKNHYLVAIQHYVTLFYIWLSFYIVIHIGLNRVWTIKRKIITSNRNRYELLFFIIGITVSALMPLTTTTIYHYHGMKASTIFSCAKVLIMTLILLASYSIIVHSVKKSSRVWKSSCYNKELLYQNKRTLKKVKRIVHLVIGGYALTLFPFISSCAVESYLYYKKDPGGDSDSLLYTFRAIAETVLYLNIIFNPIIYFYTQTDLKKEVAKLNFLKEIIIMLKALKKPNSTKKVDPKTKAVVAF